MSLRYDRTITNGDFLALLAEGGELNFLISPGQIGDDPDAIDIQLREGESITYYHGTTKLLTVSWMKDKLGWKTAHLKSGDLKMEDLHDCQGDWDLLGKMFSGLQALQGCPRGVEALRKLFRALLQVAMRKADPKYYGNLEQTEGYWHNKLCRYFGGPDWTEDREWLVFDREAVLGFDKDDPKGLTAGRLKRDFYRDCKTKYEKVRNDLQAGGKEKWGTPKKKPFGDELDLIAIDREGRLVCIELKHGSSKSGVYWGPLQAGVYCEAWERALKSDQGPQIREGICKLIEQKIEFGLLPEAARGRVPGGSFPSVEAVLAVAKPEWKADVREMLLEVHGECENECKRPVRLVEIESEMRLPPLLEGEVHA